jgi:23S rRNA pseudouridine2605 synthase
MASVKGAKTPNNHVRLNKYLAECGIASRRGSDKLITDGHVQVNGKTVYELGVQVEVAVDRITVDGKPVRLENQKIYVIFYKPENVLTTMSDPEGRPTVADFMEKLPVRVFPVGRLDWDTEGLLLLTNDGDFSQRVMHPREQIPKTYLAKLDGQPSDLQLQKLLRGVTIPGGRVKALHVERVRIGDSKQYDWIKIVIGEGKNRQVRHMFNKIGFDVKKLKRVAIGLLTLGSLQKGEHAFMDRGALAKIFRKMRDPEAEAMGRSGGSRGASAGSRRERTGARSAARADVKHGPRGGGRTGVIRNPDLDLATAETSTTDGVRGKSTKKAKSKFAPKRVSKFNTSSRRPNSNKPRKSGYQPKAKYR